MNGDSACWLEYDEMPEGLDGLVGFGADGRLRFLLDSDFPSDALGMVYSMHRSSDGSIILFPWQ
jgi:hypothetical protein